MKVFIVEDELLAVERLRMLLQEYDPSISILGAVDSIREAVDWLERHPVPDLIFLDIELADGKSFSIFTETNIKCPVIFTTAYDQYAIKAFSLISVDYLLKPVTLPALASAMNKYREMILLGSSGFSTIIAESLQRAGKNYKNRFLVKVGLRMLFIDSNEVAYFYADNKNVFLVDREGFKYLIDYSLDNLQECMDPCRFFRLNRKIICHLPAIKEIKTYFNSRLKIIIQANNQKEEVIVSRERVSAFKMWAEV